MSNATQRPTRQAWLARLLFGWLSFVVFVAVALPALGTLQALKLIRISWMYSPLGHHLIAAGILATAFLVCSKAIYKQCERLSDWLLEPASDRNRWVLVILPLIIITSYAWQLHIGFAHRGAPGWTYANIKDFVRAEAPADVNFPKNMERGAFAAALRPEAFPYVKRTGYASAEVMFLHFSDGTMRPANFELAMVSWPRSTFGLAKDNVRHGDKLIQLVRHNLAARREGRKFLLPESISYPSHLSYQRIDYSGYPSEDTLSGISLWEVVAKVDTDKVDVVGAKLLSQVNQ
ncbi:hypothetical protein [Hyphomicrobium sp.]|uniref:hypothetical protein n=1 Tax=Hyphomicrobium sp. TaxID=82 RepID=UPI002E35FA83|nr:hypothetical protein [Hyphomicrobium sp.]HEX2842737.1 hypothetical protein [Hyphomicrobium sp.]